jgi:hypothetical protein
MSIFVKLPSGYFDIDDIREQYEDLKDTSFEYGKWKPRAALIEKNGKTSWLYTGQKYDPKFIDLVEDGWTHDHCVICSRTISEKENQYTDSNGYFNGYEWVCKGCYETVISASDLEKRLAELPKYEK